MDSAVRLPPRQCNRGIRRAADQVLLGLGACTATRTAQSGTLPDGTPVNAQRHIALAVYDRATEGMKVCEVTSGPVNVTSGRFQIALPDGCASAVKSTPELWVEIQVDGASVGRNKLGVVPYALEAGHAGSADTATNATNAASAAAASSATGALNTQLSSFKTRLDALEPRATALESKKTLT